MNYDKIIVLTRSDLFKNNFDKAHELIFWNDFQLAAGDPSIYYRAEIILFLDGKKYKFLKSKYKSFQLRAKEGDEFIPPVQTDTTAKTWETVNNNVTGATTIIKTNKPMDTNKLKPFDLQAALDGKPVCTRDGRSVKIAGYNPESSGPSVLLGWVEGDYMNWYVNGNVHEDKEHEEDLFMAPTTRTVWVNLNINYSNQLDAAFYDSEAIADKHQPENRFGGKAHPITIEE